MLHLAGSSTWGTICKYQNGMPLVAIIAFNIGEVWNPVCCHGNQTVKFILCSTFSRILLQRIKHFWYKLAEISFFVTLNQNDVAHWANLNVLKTWRSLEWKEIQYRSEISGLRTRKTHAPFLRKRVSKNACLNTQRNICWFHDFVTCLRNWFLSLIL